MEFTGIGILDTPLAWARIERNKYAFQIAATVAAGRKPTTELVENYRAAQAAVSGLYGDE